MNQSRIESLIESAINTAIGFIVSFAAWPIAAWMTGIEYSNGQHWAVVAFFTVVSVARSYVIRRWFNARLHAAAMKLAGGS